MSIPCENCIGMAEHGCYCESLVGDVGLWEDEPCGRLVAPATICGGIMVRLDEKNCSCHISPPCSNCVDALFYCSGCGFKTEEP